MENKPEEVKPQEQKAQEPVNEICKDCMRWERFQRKCSVFWEGKKWCTFKVTSMEEWREHDRIVGQSFY